MTSPLNVPSSAARRERARAAQRFERSVADRRLASTAAIGLLIAAGILAMANGLSFPLLFVAVGAIALASITKSRSNRLERKLWWHQARSGLVDALEEQARAKARAKAKVIDLRDDQVIDLREATEGALPQNSDDQSHN